MMPSSKASKEDNTPFLSDPLVLRAISSFMPKQVFERVSRNPENLDRVGERRVVTVVFVDIDGFTPFCEGRDAEEVILLLNELFSKILEPVLRYGGTVDKFLGDAAMILFGAPVLHEDDPVRAIAASLEIMQKIAEFKELSISIGINTGQVVAGVVGNDEHREYTVIGDAVNIASRLESTAGSGEIIVGPETYQKSKNAFDFSEPRKLLLKGKATTLEARAVIRPKSSDSGEDTSRLIGKNTIKSRIEASIEKKVNTLIIGEAGVGKTLLLNHLKSQLTTTGNQVIQIEGAKWLENIPYAPLRKKIVEILGSKPEKTFYKLLPQRIGLFPLFSGILETTITDTDKTRYLSPHEKSELLDELIIELFTYIRRSARQVILIDNIDSLDPSSRRIITALAKSQVNIIIATARKLDHWEKKLFPSRLTIKAFSSSQTSALIKEILATTKVSSGLVRKVFEQTRGNPGHIVELVSLLREKERFLKKSGTIDIDGRIESILPGGIGDILTARLDNLPPDARELVRSASVLGMEFPESLLLQISSADIAEKGIADLISSGFFVRSGENLRFTSASLMTAIYGSLFLSTRSQIHLGAAEKIESIFKDSLPTYYEILANHYSNCAYAEKTFVFNILAGRKQEKSFANEEAQFFYERALAVSDAEVRKWRRVTDLLAVIENTGRLFWYAGDLLKVIKLNERAQRLAKQSGFTALQTDSLNRIALANHELGRFSDAKLLYDKLLRLLKKIPNETERYLQAITNYGTLLSDLGELDAARQIYLKGLELVSEGQDSAGAANLFGNLSWLEAQTGNLPAAERYLRLSGDIDEKLGNLRGIAINSINLAQVFRKKGERLSEAEQYHKALEIFEKIGDNRGKALCLSNLGDVNRWSGDIIRAKKLHRESLMLAKLIDDSQRIVDAMLGLALDVAAEGKIKTARIGIERALQITKSAGDWEGQIDCSIELVRLLPRDSKVASALLKELKELILVFNPSAIDRLREFEA